jgi:hypothetical protein
MQVLGLLESDSISVEISTEAERLRHHSCHRAVGNDLRWIRCGGCREMRVPRKADVAC